MLKALVFLQKLRTPIDSFCMIKQAYRAIVVGQRDEQVLVECRDSQLQYFGHAALENILGFFWLLGWEGDDMSAFSGSVDGAFVEVDAVDEGRSTELDLVLVKQVLHIDLAYYLSALDVPMD